MGLNSVFSPIRGSFRAPNRFLAQSSAGFGLQIGFWRNPRRVLGLNPVFDPILGGFWAPKRFLVQSSAGFGLQIGFWCETRRVLGSKSIFGAILSGFWASNRFLAQSSPGFGLQIGFWCETRRVSGIRVGANCIRPTDVPTGTGTRTYLFGPTGPSNGAYAIRPYMYQACLSCLGRGR